MAFNPFEPTEKEKQFNPFEPEINDDDNVFEAAYHGLAGAAGNVIKTAGHMLNYEGKPAYMSDEEWARRQDGSTVFGINKAIENFGREMEEKHQRNYSEPLGANSIASGIGSVVPYAVTLGLTARSGRAIDPAGLGEAAGVQLGQKVAPRFGQTAARITEAVVPGLALGQRQAFPEALIEMENAQEDYIENAKAQGKYKPGITEAEAERISRSVLEGNLGFITGTDAAQNALINSIALGQGSRGRRALQAIGIGGGINAAQEIGQQIIPKEAKGEDWSFTDPDIVASGIIGGITGGLPSAVAAAIDSRSRTADNFGENAVNDALNAGIAGAANGKEAFINAIAGQESGGDYNAVNGRTGAAGKYQIMPENWPAWAEEAGIGSDAEMTPENQEIVARFKLGQYYDKYGARDAAIAWYGGEGAINYSDEAKNRKQGNGNEPSINEYADSVMARMGAGVGRRDLRSMYADEADVLQDVGISEEQQNAPVPARGFDVSGIAQAEAENNAATTSAEERGYDVRQARSEASDYNDLIDKAIEASAQGQWSTPQGAPAFRMPRRSGSSTYNPATAMETPFLDRVNRQNVNRRADELVVENQRVMQETAGHRQRFTGQGTPTFRALIQRTKNAREQALRNDVLNNQNLESLTNRAMRGDHSASRTFNGLRPEVQRVLLNRHIDRLLEQNNAVEADAAYKALRLVEDKQAAKERAQREANKRELLQSAEEYFRESYDNPVVGVRTELQDAKAGIKNLLRPIVDTILSGGGTKPILVEDEAGYRRLRVGQNLPYYSDLYKKYGRRPTFKELYDEARDIYTGKSNIALPGWEVNQENEAEFKRNAESLQELDDIVEAYETIEKKFMAEPNGGKINGTNKEQYKNNNQNSEPKESEQSRETGKESENTEAENEVSKKAKEVVANLQAEDVNRITKKTNVDKRLIRKTKEELYNIALDDINSKIGKTYSDPLNNSVYFAPGNTETVESYTLHLIAGQNKPMEDIRVQRVMGLLLADETIKNPLAIVRQNNGRKMYLAMYQGENNMTNGLVIGVEEGQDGRVVTSTLTADKKGDKKAALREFKKRVSGADEVLYIWEGLTGRSRPSADQQASQSNAELHLSGDNIIPQNENKNQPLPAAEDRRAADTSNGTSSVTGDTGFSTSNVVQETENVKANATDNAQDGAQRAETGRQERTPVQDEKAAETEAEPSEQAKKRIGEKFNVFDTNSDDYAREIEISKIRKVGGNYYYGDSRNARLFKIDDIKTGRSDELAAEIANEQRRIEDARAERQEREAKTTKNTDKSVEEFTKELKPVQRGNLMKVLSKKLNYGTDEGVKTRAQHIRDVLKNGNFVTEKQSGKKIEYRIYDGKGDSGAFEIITKAEYDYYNWLKEQGANETQGAEAGKQETKPAAGQKEPKAKIEDFGEKIGGARKDVYAVYKELFGKAEKLDVETVPLSKSWPEPDYEKLIENGADERKVALFRATRDAIPAKPRSGRGASDWVYMVKTLREYANNILNGDGEVDFDAEQKKYKNRTFNRIIGRAKLYEVAGHKYSLKGIALEPHSYLAFMGERYKTPKTFWVVEQQAKASALSAFPKILAYGTSEAEAIKKFKDSYENIVAGKAKKPQVSFEIYIDSKTKGPFIGKKIRGNVIRLKEGFKSIAEAREYKAKHEDELMEQLEKIKEVPMERGDINHPRVGADMRGGKDVTPEMFTEAFGFRGVEFGNWVENDRRQQDLNNAYDALMDMAAIINIKPKAISLNGTLGLAFGARGRGGKNAASAHYEPGFMAINLTKMNGAGSLGHEWFHALDNMFGKKSKATYASASGNVALRQFGINNVDVAGDIRPEVVDAFAGIRRAILKSGMYNRAQKLDSVRTKDYWGTMEEMHARAFEKYLIDKLRDQGASNDYLANILTEEQWNAAAASGVNKDNTYPYPTDKEMPEIRAAFDNLFNVIEQVETDKGVMLNEEVQSYGADDIMNVSEEYYQQALFDYPEIASSERVKNRVRNSIQGTLDFGALPEEILETASEQDVSQDKKRDTGRDIQYGGTSGKIPQLSKTLGIGITRQLVNDGAISLTGKKINSLQELAEYAQVLRHPGYEKFHRVYVNKNGVIIGHETISTMMPSETRVVEGRDDNERAENANKHADMLRANKDIAKVYYIHNHPSGNPEPSLLDMDVTRDYLSQAAGDKFGGHIVLDTTQYAQIDGGGNVTYGEISDGKQIKYDVAGLPHKALGRKLLSNTVARLVKTLDDSSKTTVFFTDAKLNVRAVVQLPEGVNRLSTAGLNRYLRLKARDNYSSRALISTSDKAVYEKAKTLVQNGRLIEAILTKDRDVALSGRTEIENSGGTAEEDGTFFGETSRDRGAMRLLEENKRYINTPSQIKSASENNGEFNTDTPDIRYAATTEPAAQRSSEEVLRELQDALPNGKFEDAGNGEYTVTLPNNARVKVNIADRMVVNNREAARARGAHGLMRGGELNIEGSWQSFKGSDVDGLLNLSRTGRAGTAYHEVMHAAMDLALTEKEQQAMVKHFNKEAQATGKTVSEAISDGYVEWKRARAQRRGTLFGKLYNKMQDMLNTLKSLFTGVENAHNVMRRVESGEVWQRSRGTLYSGDSAPKFNVSSNKISQFVNVALKNADKNLRLLLGKVSNGEAKAIKDSTGYDVSGFTHVWLSEDVRHIQNRHGVKTEKVKGQIGLSEADMVEALEAIKSPNRIEKGSPTSNGEPSIRFIKQTGTGEYTVVEVVRQKNKRLAVKTMWKTASENTKEAATATLRADNSPQYTSETDSGETASVRKNINQSSSFNQNISQQSPEVNGSNVQYSAEELTPEQKIGKAVINTERKGTFQKAKEWIKKQKDEFYRDWFDKNTSLNDLVAGLEMTLGRKLTEGENIYNRVQTLPSTAAGMATALIEGGVEHLKVINSRLKNVKLKHFVTLQMVLDNINREKMDKAHPDYLKRGGFKTWIDAFGAYLTSIRLNEMLLLHDEAYQQKVNEWKQRVAARQKWEADGAKGVPPQEAIHQEWEDFQKALDRAYRKWSDKNGNNKQGDDPRIAMRKEWLKTHKTLDEPLKTVGKKPEYKPYLLPKGLTQDDLESVIKNAPPEFRKAAQMYWQFNDNVLTIMEDAGLISGETHKLLNTKYKYYCPLMRDFSDTAAADAFIGGLGNGGRGIGNVSNMLKKIGLEGSERAVLNPLESTVKAVAVACNRAERNKVGQLAVQLAEKGGMDGVIQKVEGTTADAKNCVFTVMFDGKKQAYKTTPELYDPIVGYNLPSASFVFGVARNAARLLRAGATSSPSFIIRNFIRDTIFAGVSSKNGFKPVVDSIRGMYALARDPRLKAEFKVAGVTAFKQYSNAETAAKSLDQMAGGKAWRNYDIADWWNAFIGKFQSWSEFAEAGTRMGEFMRARANGKSLEEAARDAREVTLDFSRSGVYGERVNRYVPFFNAVLQGGDKMIRLLKDDPVNTAVKLTKYIILPSLVFWLFNHDEDWYKELDPEIKATCWIIPGGVYRIPKPQEAGILFGSGIEAVLDQAFDKDPEAISNWAEVFRENILPSIFPTVFLPLWEWRSNYSNFRDATLVPQRLQNLPDELQYTPNTSAAARTLGGALKLSPVKIDNAIRGYTGTMGMTLVQALDFFADEKQNMPYKKVSEWPFLRDFTVNQNIQNRSVDDFYKMLRKANEQHAGYGKKGKPTPAVQGVRKAGQLISKAQKDIRELTVNPRLSPEAKRQRIDQKKTYIKNVANKANNRFGKFFED